MEAYGKAAIAAAEAIANFPALTPRDAWNTAVASIFSHSKSLQEKSCPKSTFLGLCQSGRVNKVPKGSYTKSIDNMEYGLRAIQLLGNNPEFRTSSNALWEAVIGNVEKCHNSQMDVVIALWNANLISQEGKLQ